MKYTLIIGIQYKKFKNPAKITLQIGDRFIDTFDMEKDYLHINDTMGQKENHWFEKWNEPFYDCANRANDPHNSIPSFYKIYQIEEEYLNDFLDIKIENSNNDYTNSFMKRNSMLKLSIVCLFPRVLANNLGQRLREVCTKINFVDKGNFKTAEEKWKHNPDYWGNKPTWPIPDSFVEIRNSARTQESREIKGRYDWIGGSFTARFPIRKKHKVKYLGSLRHKEQGFILPAHNETHFIASYKPLLNIYDED